MQLFLLKPLTYGLHVSKLKETHETKTIITFTFLLKKNIITKNITKNIFFNKCTVCLTY